MAELKILSACIPTPGNRYLIDLKEGLETYAEVIWDYKAFWECQDRFDVVHIHWPEYLSYDIEAYLYTQNAISDALWKSLKHCLDHWSRHAKIIYTRHNALPHARQDSDFKALYQLVSSYAHTVVHFAHYSMQQFKEWYPELPHIKHVVIPHHNYASLPNTTTNKKARQQLGIALDTYVMLVFGGVRQDQKKLIQQAFKHIPVKKKLLLAPKMKLNKLKKIPFLGYRFWLLMKWVKRIFNKQRIDEGHVKESDLQYYLNSADVLFIPRTYELNSGNIALGFTFGLVVIGKDDGNIGEILTDTGNPTFKLNNLKSLERAILTAVTLNANNYGKQNKIRANRDWSLEKISKNYIELIEEII